ncbi:hypothetical protein M5K25_013753 [Dendrobium thyrsiflorum]|uniref:RNase H type-1 domain-containing protein n=1 Tax=Dendrobium thyrsiflorum TaxID=117978 RepID=A0ABD0UU86_DENTH
MVNQQLKHSDLGFLDSKDTSKSFKDALAASSSSHHFPDLVCSTQRGLPSLWIFEEEILALAAPFKFALVGKFSVKRLSLNNIHKHVLIKLSNNLDYNRIFARCTYYVNNYFMKLIKWSPLFDITTESPIIHVWISFPNLRPHLFTHYILHGLGSLFGRPLQIDSAIASGSHPSMARILYLDSIWLGPEKYGYNQKVIFSDFPSFCEYCKVLGHNKMECFHLHPHLRKWSTKKRLTLLYPFLMLNADDLLKASKNTLQHPCSLIKETMVNPNTGNTLNPNNPIDIEPNLDVESISKNNSNGIELMVSLSAISKKNSGNMDIVGIAICTNNDNVDYDFLGVPPPSLPAIEDFNNMIMKCGSKFMWTNNHLWQRLDKILFNFDWVAALSNTMMNRKAPLAYYDGSNDIITFYLKCKRLKHVLRWWKKNVIGNLFENIIKDENKVFLLEDNFMLNNSNENKKYWRQRAISKSLYEGDQNTKYFHARANSKKSKYLSHNIKLQDGSFLENEEDVSKSAIDYFSNDNWHYNLLIDFLHKPMADSIFNIPLDLNRADTMIFNKSKDDEFCSKDVWNAIIFRSSKLMICFSNRWACHIAIIVIMIVFWLLWLERNNSKHLGVNMKCERIIICLELKIYQMYNAKLLLPKHFKGVMSWTNYFQISFDKKNIRNLFSVVYWVKSSFNQFKLNVDGYFSKVGAGYGGIFRNFKGNMVFGSAEKVHNGNVIIAEASALLLGLNLCSQFNIQNVWIESDSLIMFNLNKSNFCNNASLFYIFRIIMNHLKCIEYIISHIPRSGWLARKGFSLRETEIYTSMPNLHDLTCYVIRALLMDLIYMSNWLNLGMRSFYHGFGTLNGFYAIIDLSFDVECQSQLRDAFRSIMNHLKHIEYIISHIPRSGWLARKGFSLREIEIYTSLSNLHVLKGLVRMDKLGFSTFKRWSLISLIIVVSLAGFDLLCYPGSADGPVAGMLHGHHTLEC